MKTNYFSLLLAGILLACNSQDNNSLTKNTDTIPTQVPASVFSMTAFNMLISSKKNSGLQAIPIWESEIKKIKPELWNDSIYQVYYDEHQSVIGICNDSLFKNSDLMNKLGSGTSTPDLTAYNKRLENFGMITGFVEGTPYITHMPDYYLRLFGDVCTPAMKKYLEQSSIADKGGFVEDGGMIISYEDLYIRMANWSKFMAEFPDFSLNSKVKEKNNIYLTVFFVGEDNTPVFDYESKQIQSEIKSLYEKVIKEQKAPALDKLIKEYYDFIAQTSFKRTDELEVFLKQKGLRP